MTSRDERLIGNSSGDGQEPALPMRGRRSSQEPNPRAARGDDRVFDERGAYEREQTENRELSDDERVEMFRSSLHQSILPDLPKIDGYHVCWLTTNNPRDSIGHRMRLGYELIRASECPGWDGETLNVGRVDGVVGVEEMVAAKIRLNLYDRYMRSAHYDAPFAEEEKILSAVERLEEEAGRMRLRVERGNGLDSLRSRAPRPPPMTE